jgi:RHS repeat-associated protein
MARTAPVPNIPAIPGMCPGICVLGGGGGSGGGSGKGAEGRGGGVGAGGEGGAEGTAGDARGAPDGTEFPGCGTASHPVDVVTGRAFTHPVSDLYLPGFIDLELERTYSSKMAHRDTGMGFGWGHTLGWELVVERRRVTVWSPKGVAVDFPRLEVGEETIGPWGWVLRREAWGYGVDRDDGHWYLMGHVSETDKATGEGKRYRLSAIQDRNDHRIELFYDERGRLQEIVDSVGRKILVGTNADGRITSYKVDDPSPGGHAITFARYLYDAAGNLVDATDADGHVCRYAYDDEHRLTRDTDRAGLTFHFRYDERGRCIESWGDYGERPDPSLADDVPATLADGTTRAKGIHHCRFAYDEGGYSEVTDTTEVRRFFGNAHGLLDKRVDGTGVTTSSYDEHGRLTATTDALGYTKRFKRDRRGRIVEVIDAMERVTRVEYHASGLPERLVDTLGGEVRVERDRRGNAIRTINACGDVTTHRRDERGLAIEVVDAAGQSQRMEYDQHANVTAIVLPNGARFGYSYDWFGRRVSCTSPDGHVTRYQYSNRGDLVVIVDETSQNTERYEYDGEGHLVRMAFPSGATVSFVWGGYHQVCAHVDPEGRATELRYGREGELRYVQNAAGNRHRFHYDPNLALIGEDTIDGRELRYKNDLLGRLVRYESNAGELVDFEYLPTGELSSRIYGDGSFDRFSYDKGGRLVGCDSGQSAYHLELDPMGRIVRDTQIVDGETLWVRYRYDARGQVVELSTSRGHRERIERDAIGQRSRTELGDGYVLEHQHDLLGREIARRMPGGGRLESAFDHEGHLTERRAHGPTAHLPTGAPEWIGGRDPSIQALQRFAYDDNGELIEELDSARGKTQYRYDPVGRLMAMMPEKARATVFSYDETGNRLERDGEGNELPRRYDGTRLVEKGDFTYHYDDAGRLSEKRRNGEVWRYHYDGRGFLQRTEAPDGTVVSFVYDAHARRLAKRVHRPVAEGLPPAPVSYTRFLWTADRLVEEIRRNGESAADPVVEERTYLFEDDSLEPMAHRRRQPDTDQGGDWLVYMNTPTGAPNRLIDRRGQVVAELRQTGWGRFEVVEGDRDCTPLRMQGQYEDAETGLAYNHHRYFDPDSGLFISPDPLGVQGSVHPYRYAPNPLNWVDTDGLTPKPIPKANGKPTLLGRYMETRVEPAAKGPSYSGSPGPSGFHTFQTNPQKYKNKGVPGAEEAWKKNQERWIRDQIDSGREIYDIGSPPGASFSEYCNIEREELENAGFTKVCTGKTVEWTNPKTGATESAKLYQWVPPPGFKPGDYKKQRQRMRYP